MRRVIEEIAFFVIWLLLIAGLILTCAALMMKAAS